MNGIITESAEALRHAFASHASPRSEIRRPPQSPPSGKRRQEGRRVAPPSIPPQEFHVRDNWRRIHEGAMAAVHHPYERTRDVIRLADILKVVLSRYVDENEWRFSPVSLSLPCEWDFSIFQWLRIPPRCQFRNLSRRERKRDGV